jgi:hypothetical protein
MSGFEAVGLGMTLAGAGLSAFSKVQQGQEASRAALFEQQQLQTQAMQFRTAADQAEAKRREELTSNIETIAAIRAGRGVGATSPTAMAIFDKTVSDAEGDIATERVNYLTRADLSERAGIMAERKARTSLLAGYVGAGADILSTGAKLAGYAYGTQGIRASRPAMTNDPTRLGALY